MRKLKSAVALIYRHPPKTAYSIEYLFDHLLPLLQPHIDIQKVILPQPTQGAGNILKNLLFMTRVQSRIAHVTGDCYYALLTAFNCRRMVTYHDLSFLERTTGIRRWLLKTFWVSLPLVRAHQVVTVSKTTKLALHKATGIPAERIQVIPNFVDKIFQPIVRSFNASRPRILQVGTDFNKNLDRLIEALSTLPCVLVIIGRLRPGQLSALQHHKVKYENYFGLGMEALHDQYVQADLLCFTSTIEGFGMPIVEAQACGLPVVTSNCSSMPEVAGSGAVLVDPFVVDSIRQAVLSVMNDEAIRKQIVNAGYENAKHYSRDAVAAAYLKLYQEELLR